MCEVSMRKWLAVAGVVLSAVVLSAATYASHIGKCPLCWGK
jgi:disulfide bond formation protein DsbB